MQDAPERNIEDSETEEEIQSIRQKIHNYTRVLIVVCLTAWAGGFLVYAAAEWLHTRRRLQFVQVIPRPPRLVIMTMKLSGATETILGFSGNWGALHMHHGMIFAFTCFLFITSVMDLCCASIMIAYMDKITLLIKDNLIWEVKLKQRTAADNNATDKFHNFQENWHCCGVNSYEDWIDSPWWKLQRNLNNSMVIPESCCKMENITCHIGPPPYRDVLDTKLVHDKGCLAVMGAHGNLLFSVTGLFAFIFGIMKLIGFYLIHYLINKLLPLLRQLREIENPS